MKHAMITVFLTVIALVLTTMPQAAYASEDKESEASCTLSYVDVYCAQNPEKCLENSALKDTSIHSDFAFAYPQHLSIQVQNTNFTQSDNSTLFGPDLNAEKLFQLVNSYRESVGLSAFEKHPDLCSVANSRGPELEEEIISGNIHGGMRSRNLPYWVTENMKWGVSEEEVLSWWLNSPVHAAAINGGDQYACAKCSGPVCIMLFTDFQSKERGVVASSGSVTGN